ncbi:NADH:flavin oxidoreductase [Senegalia massiliensis]|uniref:NADH:flavin oxidoreductase n=1 Tax=Senegalia massiliensis TaxID=1720316 RepID=UPI00102F4FC3|nr:NADH:flavin oxidoreductase [Senegalia massiliensis]
MSNLLEPLNIKNIKLKNRLVMPPMATGKSEDDGKISKEIIDYYDEKSKGSYISLIIIEHSYISQQGKASDNQLSISDDMVIDGLRNLSNVIHENGSKAVMQINHAGSASKKSVTGMNIVGPSAIAHPRSELVPNELTKDEIKEIIKDFKDAAVRVKKAGFDGVEIHSAHGYLLSQFLSPITNKRQDEYGGDLKSRIKIHLEIIDEVKKSVGEDFLLLLRLGASDYMEGGVTLDESLIASKEFEKAGIDILDISGGFNGYGVENKEVQGYFSPLTEEIKKVVNIPVILTGGITDIKAADKLLKEDKADLIGVGRAILKDSSWAKNGIQSLK